MITLHHINRVFPLKGGPFYALRDINLQIAEGEFVSVMGPSGSGKSTLLHILGLHDPTWEGEYHFRDTAVHTLNRAQRAALQKQNIGFIFQQYHLLDDLTVYENLDIPLSYRNYSKKERESIVCETLDRFAIVAKKDLYPNQLSGGQQQLVGVARALVAKPSLILADEPTGNLHSDQGHEIMALFKKLNQEQGITIVQVTHSAENAAYGNRIVRLADGMIVKPV
jgi:ABC-type lipoprotein export system ATPase subunit